jgi:hypothetical protein
LGSDVWTGSSVVINSHAYDVNGGPTDAHPDFHQSYAVAPDWVEVCMYFEVVSYSLVVIQNVILYNCKGYNITAQGLFGSRIRNSAFVNVLIEKVNTVMYSQYSGTHT